MRTTSRGVTCILLALIVVSAAAAGKTQPADGLIHDEVIRRLANDYDLKTARIEVAVQAGVVTLEGQVDTPKQKEKAEKTARKAEGVKKVVNQLQVRQ